MSELKFDIGNKSEQLYFSVFDITTSRSHYPVKYRRLSDKLQECSLDIYSDLMDANAFQTDKATHLAKRKELQTSAIAKCNKFLSLVKYSLHAKLISCATAEKWTDLAHNIKFMTLAWRRA